MDEDSPEDLCLDLLARASFGRENYGRNILGPAENVERFTREDLVGYKQKRYRPSNMVVSFAGCIGIQEAMELADRYFGDLEDVPPDKREKHVLQRRDNLFKFKPIEQAHFAFGFPTIGRDDETFPAVQVMNAVLGGGMSSRLFKRVREELGLAYSVYSYSSHYAETGLFTVYAGVNPQKAEAAARAVVEVIETFKKEGVSEEEFLRGREQLRSGNIFSQESTSSQMLLYGRNLLYTGEVYDFEARMREISDLTREDVARAIAENFDFAKAAVSSVGNLQKPIEL